MQTLEIPHWQAQAADAARMPDGWVTGGPGYVDKGELWGIDQVESCNDHNMKKKRGNWGLKYTHDLFREMEHSQATGRGSKTNTETEKYRLDEDKGRINRDMIREQTRKTQQTNNYN